MEDTSMYKSYKKPEVTNNKKVDHIHGMNSYKPHAVPNNIIVNTRNNI